MSCLVFPDLSRQYHHILIFRYAPALLEACVVYAQTISDDVGQASLQLVLPQLYHVCHHSGPDPCVARALQREHTYFSG
jgi:hypothetical protein